MASQAQPIQRSAGCSLASGNGAPSQEHLFGPGFSGDKGSIMSQQDTLRHDDNKLGPYTTNDECTLQVLLDARTGVTCRLWVHGDTPAPLFDFLSPDDWRQHQWIFRESTGRDTVFYYPIAHVIRYRRCCPSRGSP
eukprot:2106735-Rhodomonas_salina.1